MNDIQCGNVEQFVFVINIGFFQYFSSNCNCGVNWVSDNINVCFWVGFCNLLYQVFYDVGVNVKQVGMIYIWFMCYICRDKNDICVFQCWSCIFIRKIFDFYSSRDMVQIDSYIGSYWSDIIQREF